MSSGPSFLHSSFSLRRTWVCLPTWFSGGRKGQGVVKRPSLWTFLTWHRMG